MRKLLLFAFLSLFIVFSPAKNFYVSPLGDDYTGDGSVKNPFKTLQMALNYVGPGDVIYLRQGVYDIETYVEVSGTRTKPILIMSYPGEWAIFDGSGHSPSDSVKFRITGSWLIFRNFTVRNGPSDGILLTEGASHNKLENLRSHGNYFTGIELEGGAHDNLILNCDSYENFDYGETHGEHADGFGARYDVGSGNIFRYCRAWNNSDDGFDLWKAENSVLIEYCYSWGNGFDRWNVGSEFAGDGNGFKLGDSSPIIHHSISWKNKRRGFDFNDSAESEFVYNNTTYMNPVGFNFPYGRHVLINNLSYRDGENKIGYEVLSFSNSWDPFPFLLERATPTSNLIEFNSVDIYFLSIFKKDFMSLDEDVIKGERREDGNLPYFQFLRPSMDSVLRDIGIDMGDYYFGKGPDIGALEFYPIYVDIRSDEIDFKKFF